MLRDRATVEVEASAAGVPELRAAVLALTPPDHELAQLLNGGRVDGNLVGTAVFRSTATSTVEVEGRDYAAARAALAARVTADQVVLSVRVVD
jgi:hypothetical protein